MNSYINYKSSVNLYIELALTIHRIQTITMNKNTNIKEGNKSTRKI